MRKILSIVAGCALALGTVAAHADQLISPTVLKSTERGMFMTSGRYFTAGVDGVFEIKRTVDNGSHCKLDASTGYTACKLAQPKIGTETCTFSGMTTDNTYLYAVCMVADPTPVVGGLKPPKRTALFRIKPGASAAAEVKVKPFAVPVFYNGMAALDGNTLLMTPSVPLGTSPAIVKLKITNHATLDHTISPWLPGSALYLLPNGITVNDGHVYFVGGQNLWRVHITSNGTPAVPVLLFQTTVNQVLDDLVVRGDFVAVCEIGIVNGLGLNAITMVHKTGVGVPVKLWTGLTQLSGLQVDPGTFGTPGAFIGTSFFQGGVHRYFY
ncbi:MAG: hypothetical protein RLZZ618_103 [Pseudomonadota bacterium]|jgi:hypothetical protein